MSLTQMVESLRPSAPWSRLFRRFLRQAVHETGEIPYTDVLSAMGKTGPLGMDYRALTDLAGQMNRLARLTYVAVGAGLLSLLITVLALLLR